MFIEGGIEAGDTLLMNAGQKTEIDLKNIYVRNVRIIGSTLCPHSHGDHSGGEERVRRLRRKRIIVSHEFAPYGFQARGQQAVNAWLDACIVQ